MWNTILNLLAAVRRPLVVIDFETAGLGGLPPVEFAALVFAPWAPQISDETTIAAARECPPGLTYACEARVDPLRPIDPDASRVHGIRDEDVCGKCRPFNDLEYRGFFQGLASGDPDDGSGPAIFAGHNVAEADVPWATTWGYLPAHPLDLVDTLRLVRRLQRDAPWPLVPDIVEPLPLCDGPRAWTSDHCPAIGLGLDAFAASLTGAHVGLLGERPTKGHGALADCCSTTRVLHRILSQWDGLWRPLAMPADTSAALSTVISLLAAPPEGQVAWDGWLSVAPGPKGQPDAYHWRRGKFKGRPVHRDAWVLGLPRAPTGREGEHYWCAEETARIVEAAR